MKQNIDNKIEKKNHSKHGKISEIWLVDKGTILAALHSASWILHYTSGNVILHMEQLILQKEKKTVRKKKGDWINPVLGNQRTIAETFLLTNLSW